MKILKQKYRPIARIQQIPQLFYLIKWTVLSALAGGCIGSASALLLVSLQWAKSIASHTSQGIRASIPHKLLAVLRTYSPGERKAASCTLDIKQKYRIEILKAQKIDIYSPDSLTFAQKYI